MAISGKAMNLLRTGNNLPPPFVLGPNPVQSADLRSTQNYKWMKEQSTYECAQSDPIELALAHRPRIYGARDNYSLKHQAFNSTNEFPRQEHPQSTSISRSCHLASGAVDVEDLALYLDVAKLQANCPTNNDRARQTEYSCRPPVKDAQDRGENVGFTRAQFRDDKEIVECGWLDEISRNQSACEDCPEAFGLCPEEQWLQCPVSDCCPLYGGNFHSGQAFQTPACYYERENFAYDQGSMPYWLYPYVADDQLLEDYLSNEKRKERSRDAARYRRSRETDIFSDLAAVLPISQEQAAHLDKASVMRLAIAYLRVRAVVDSIPVPVAKSDTNTEMDELFPKALNGFILVLSSDGSMVYLSENVSDYLGVCQMDLMGQSVYEYSHPCDHEELRECLSANPDDNDDGHTCSFFLRLKCTLTSKGRKVNLKSASYKVIHCIGRLTKIRDTNSNCKEETDEEAESGEESKNRDTESESETSLVLVGSPIPHPSNIEMPLGRHTFLSKHNLHMKFTYADEKLAEYLGWNSEELVGQSVFEFYHALDNLALDKSFKSLFSKGQCETVAYRFLGKRGGYAWVVTQATVIHCSKQQKPLSVVCVNYILSGVEHEDEVYSARQLAARDTEQALSEKEQTDQVKEEARPEQKQELPEDEPTIGAPAADAKLTLQLRFSKRELAQNCFVSTEGQLPAALQKELEAGLERRNLNGDKPLAVTASLFRPANPHEGVKKVSRVQDGSRKDNTFPRPIRVTEKTFSDGARVRKKSIDQSIKENEEPEAAPREGEKQSYQEGPIPTDRRPEGRAPFVFQGKPALEYNRESTEKRYRPQAVTKFLFAPLAPATQPQVQQEQLPCRPPPQTATARIFAPRTEDMNKGFLTFSEDQPGLTMLKDEPEDLTHLAPTPGDVCVPLEDTPFLSDMLDDFILGNDNYCPLLSPGGTMPTADFTDTLKESELIETNRRKTLGESLTDGGDPFMYAECPASPVVDSSTVSPALSKYQSPENSIESLSSPTTGSVTEGFSEDEILMLGISESIADEELELRAPYIPMSDQDETLEQLMSDEMVMWGGDTHGGDKLPSKWLVDERDQSPADSSLAQLLKTDQIASKKYNDHGNGLVNPTQVLGQIPRKGAAYEIGRWPSKGSNDRPSKRIHATTSSYIENENKRIKCDGSSNLETALKLEEDILLEKRPIPVKAIAGFGATDSQLLRRLVSQQTTISQADYPGTILNDTNLARNSARKPTPSMDMGVERTLELQHADPVLGHPDVGGGDPEGSGSHQDSKGTTPCNSVLMNLLVSGCDDPLEECRCVPAMSSLPKDYGSPLSVCLDNQMVPQCATSNGSSISFEQIDAERAKGLNDLRGFPSSENRGVATASPSSIMSFDMMDYDPGISETGLLQVNPEFFGTLLDQNLV